MHKVVDTNVLIVASLVDIETDERASKEHPIEERFQTKVHDWLEDFMEADDPVCLDSAGAIAKEYRNNLTEQDFAFFLVDRKWNNAQVEFFDINFDTHGNAILEAELNKIIHDLSDRKFVAVAQAAKTEHNECVIVNATDTDWHDWERDLRKKGFNIEFLIPEYSVDVWKKKKMSS